MGKEQGDEKAMKRYAETFRFWRCFDFSLFIPALLLCVIGIIALLATGYPEIVQRQIISLVIACGVYLICASIDYRSFKSIAEVLYGSVIFLLIIVLNLGYEAYGAQRWIALGVFSFQPSELAKLALIISMAKFLELRQAKLNSILETIPSFILVGIPFFIIFKQPDLGTSIVLLMLFATMSLWAGMSVFRLFLLSSPLLSIVVLYVIPVYPLVSWLVYLGIVFILLRLNRVQVLDSGIFLSLNVLSGIFSPYLWNTLSQYQQNRIISFLNPDIDPLARGLRYHTVKSVIAVGSGGWLGKGFMQGPLANLQYIPQQHTDFIFSVIGEEFGIWGTLLVVGLFAYLCYRLLVIASQSSTTFGTLVTIGTLTMIFFQAFVNIGMNIGLVPVVGIPLPFISYGGTSLIVTFAALGIVQSIAMRRKDIIF